MVDNDFYSGGLKEWDKPLRKKATSAGTNVGHMYVTFTGRFVVFCKEALSHSFTPPESKSFSLVHFFCTNRKIPTYISFYIPGGLKE